MTTNTRHSHLTDDQVVRLNAVKVREAVNLGPDNSGASGTDRVMIAFATCDRQRWIPKDNASSTELWAKLTDQQRSAVALYLNAN